MQFELTQEFPVGLERLWASLGRADYVERKYRALGSSSLRILKFHADAQSIEVELERQTDAVRDLLPPWARLIAGRRYRVCHHARWTRVKPKRAEVSLEILVPSLLLSAKGIGSVVERAPGRSRLALRFDVGCTSTAFASGVARVFARQVRRALEADHAFTLDYLRSAPAFAL